MPKKSRRLSGREMSPRVLGGVHFSARLLKDELVLAVKIPLKASGRQESLGGNGSDLADMEDA